MDSQPTAHDRRVSTSAADDELATSVRHRGSAARPGGEVGEGAPEVGRVLALAAPRHFRPDDPPTDPPSRCTGPHARLQTAVVGQLAAPHPYPPDRSVVAADTAGCDTDRT